MHDADPTSAHNNTNSYGLPAVLSVEEAARFLRLNIKTVYAAITAHQLPARTVGKRLVILRDALLQSLEHERVLPQRNRKRG